MAPSKTYRLITLFLFMVIIWFGCVYFFAKTVEKGDVYNPEHFVVSSKTNGPNKTIVYMGQQQTIEKIVDLKDEVLTELKGLKELLKATRLQVPKQLEEHEMDSKSKSNDNNPKPMQSSKATIQSLPIDNYIGDDDYIDGRTFRHSWRTGKIDWHQQVPSELPSIEDLKYTSLMYRERSTLEFLSGRMFRQRHYGPLAKFAGCGLMRDDCIIHNTTELCLEDGFCGWCESNQLCVNKMNPILPESEGREAVRACIGKIITRGDEKQKLSSTSSKVERVRNGMKSTITREEGLESCKVIVTVPTFFVRLNDNAVMLYHFFRENYRTVYNDIESSGTLTSGNFHIIIEKSGFDRRHPVSSELYEYFQVLTNFCVRSIKEIPDDTCFVKAPYHRGSAVGETYQNYLVQRVGLHTIPKPIVPKIGIISRRLKRVILNEEELIQVLRAKGYEAYLFAFEDMTVYEQLKACRMVNILIGMHGSGLLNAQFMHPGSVLIQLLQYKLDRGPGDNVILSFKTTAEEHGVKYLQWRNERVENTLFHWHFFDSQRYSKSSAIEKGSSCCDTNTFFAFFVNQDTYVDVSEFLSLVENAVHLLQ